MILHHHKSQPKTLSIIPQTTLLLSDTMTLAPYTNLVTLSDIQNQRMQIQNPNRTEKLVVDSDGTVIFTHGKLTRGSLLIRKKSVERGKPLILLVMSVVSIDEAVGILRCFLRKMILRLLILMAVRVVRMG